jgi:hypothetical protein
MPEVFTISNLLSIVSDVFNFLTDKASAKKENVIMAHSAMNKAFIQTYDYLKNKMGEYKPMPSLADAWNDAATAVMKVNPGLGGILYHKSRFWLDPQLYFNLNRQDEIIELNQIIEEMERLRMKLN